MNSLFVSLLLHLLHSVLLLTLLQMHLQEEEQKDVSYYFAREEQHKDSKTGYMYERWVPERRAEFRQRYAQANPLCREELLPSISRVETHLCFPAWVQEEPYAWWENSWQPLVDSNFFCCSRNIKQRNHISQAKRHHPCTCFTYMYIHIHTHNIYIFYQKGQLVLN